ncbi:hypothetical protein B0H14DRAFT_3141896 [Mycena olivaceomarginata]|nr:hypothetical protein B0H14DRAFT_3141896 [Mycena olivaceomarginata]
MRAGGGAVRTGSVQQGQAARACAAHGGHTEEGVGPLGYAWRRVRPSRIGGASPGSERRGRDSKQTHGGAGGGKVFRNTGSALGRGVIFGRVAGGWARSSGRGVLRVGLKFRGQEIWHWHGQRSVISGGIRAIQSSGSDIEVARTRKDSMVKAQNCSGVQRVRGASVVEEQER